MILSTSVVDQVVDGDWCETFVRDIILTRPRGQHGAGPTAGPVDVPLAMVRKRLGRLDPSGASELVQPEPTKAPVLLVHGYGQNRYAWHLPGRSFANYLAACGYDVFSMDLRGHGRSRHLGARPPKHLAEYVREDLPAALREVRSLVGARRVFLIGHSLGGLISYAVAPALGDAVAGVVTLGSPYHFTRGSRALSAMGSLVLSLDRALALGHGLVPLRHLAEVMRLARVLIESPLVPMPIRGYAPGSLEPRILGQHMALAMDRGSVAVMRDLLLSAAEARASGHRLGVLYGFAPAFEAADIALLVIAGSCDSLAPPDSVRPAYVRSHATDKTYRVFPRGHLDLLVGREAPITVWPTVASWLDARVRWAGSGARAPATGSRSSPSRRAS